MSSKFDHFAAFVLGALVIVSTVPGYVVGSEFPLKRDQRVLVRTQAGGAFSGYFAGVYKRNIYLSSRGELSIDQVTTSRNDTVCFPFGGARYNAVTDSLSGMAADGRTIGLALSDIRAVDLVVWSGGRRDIVTLDQDACRGRLRAGVRYPTLKLLPVDSLGYVKTWHNGSAVAPWLGALCGGMIGAAIGSTEEDDWLLLSKETKMTLDIIFGTLIGAGAGVLIGRGHWEEIPVDRLKVTVTPAYNGGIGMSAVLKF